MLCITGMGNKFCLGATLQGHRLADI